MLSFVAGGFAGLVAQTLTQPLHVVRRRMQVEVGRGRPALECSSRCHAQ